MANFSFLTSGSNLYKPTPDPYQGAGFYTRTPGQELLELRAKTQDRARQIYEEAQLKKERERQNFLATVAGPQNLFEAPRNPRERAVQELVNADIMGRRTGVEMAPKWDATRRKQISDDLALRNQIDDYDWQGISRKMTLDNARQNFDLRDAALGLREDEFLAEQDAQAEDFRLDKLDQMYADAQDMIINGVPPEQVGRIFPQLPMQYRLQLAALARSPVVRAGITKATGGATANPQARQLADEYNRREAASRKNAANVAAMRQTKIPGVLDYFLPGEWGGPDSQAIANYPGTIEDMDAVFKADSAAKKLIRRGDSGWEPILGGGYGMESNPNPLVRELYARQQSAALQPGPTSVGSGTTGIVRVNSPAEAARLPRGTMVMLPDGRVFPRK
jgi:hypothetical protein